MQRTGTAGLAHRPGFFRRRLRANALGDEELLALGYENIILTRRGFWS